MFVSLIKRKKVQVCLVFEWSNKWIISWNNEHVEEKKKKKEMQNSNINVWHIEKIFEEWT
jgi:hypothetical protein